MSTTIARPSSPVPPNEAERMAALRRLAIVDTPPERAYDDIVELASAICGTPIAAMTLIDGQRQWFKSKVGLPFDETPREEAFCAHTILGDALFVVEDATKDERFSDMLSVQYSGIRFYAGSPIHSPDGFPLGALCVIDVQSRALTPAQGSALEALRRLVEGQLELRRANMELVRLEKQKRELTELVVHDLKNPIASILPNAKYLAKAQGLNETARSAAIDISTSTQSMLRLVMNILDISRAEDATMSARRTDVDLPVLFEEVRTTLAARAADQEARLELVLGADVGMVSLDQDLTRRVLENLGDNALKYAPGGTVTLSATVDPVDIVLAVSDDGPGIPESERERVFEKYARVSGSPHSDRSRGLGLTFCKLAAEAHGGSIACEANEPRGTRFRVRIPR